MDNCCELISICLLFVDKNVTNEYMDHFSKLLGPIVMGIELITVVLYQLYSPEAHTIFPLQIDLDLDFI